MQARPQGRRLPAKRLLDKAITGNQRCFPCDGEMYGW